MPPRTTSIAFVMRLTAIIALNLAVIRFVPGMLFQLLPFVFAIAVIDLVLVQAFGLGRPLGSSHYTFIVAGLFSTAVVSIIAFNQPIQRAGTLHILNDAILAFRAAIGEPPGTPPYRDWPLLAVADEYLTYVVAFVPAWAAGALVSRWMHRRDGRPTRWGHRVAAFCQGALIGLGAFSIGVLTTAGAYAMNPWVIDPRLALPLRYLFVAILVLCPLVGGIAIAAIRGASTAAQESRV